MAALDLLGPANAPNATTTRPADGRVFGNDDTWLKGCSSPDLDDGTEISAELLNAIIALLRNAIRGMGVTPNNADDDMLLKAIKANGLPYFADTGAANTMVITSPSGSAVNAYASPMVMLVKAGNSVTGAATINRDTVGAKAIIHPDGSPLTKGDWPKDGIGLIVYDGTSFQLLTMFSSQIGQPFGQCYLSLSGGNLLLTRRNGRSIFVAGAYRPIPAAGITLSPSGLTTGTLHYVYVKWTGSALALDVSTTGWIVDPETGCPVKSDAPGWTLVGMAYVVAGPAFADTDGQLYVLSYFNRKPKTSRTQFSTGRSTATGAWIELHTEIRNLFLTWADEEVFFDVMGSGGSTGTVNFATSVGFDGTTPEIGAPYFETPMAGGNYNHPIQARGRKRGLSEGAHFCTLLICPDGVGNPTMVLGANSNPFGTVLQVQVRG